MPSYTMDELRRDHTNHITLVRCLSPNNPYLLDLICPAEWLIAPISESKLTSLILFLPNVVHFGYHAIGEWHGCKTSSLQDSTSVQTIKLHATLKIPSWSQGYAFMGPGYSRVGWGRLVMYLAVCANFHSAMFFCNSSSI